MNQATQVAFPTRGQIYTLAEICKQPLRDTACLRFMHNGRWEYVNNVSTDMTALCAKNPIIADSRWVFERETHEWIPVFNYAKDNDFDIDQVVTIEPTKWVDHHGRPEPQQYVRFIGDYEPELVEAEERLVAERKANPVPLPVVKVEEPVEPVLEPAIEPVVMQPAPSPVQFCFTTPEMLEDPSKAKIYVEDRSENAKTFRDSLVWDCSAEDDLDKAKLYFAGIVHRYKPNHTLRSVYWGMADLFDVGGKPRTPVYFKTEDCFVAWALARFW